MTSETFIKVELIEKTESRIKWSGWHFGAGAGLIGGFLLIVMAFVLTPIVSFFRFESPQISLQSIINLLFYLAIPALFGGAHCLDKIESQRKSKRNTKFRNKQTLCRKWN